MQNVISILGSTGSIGRQTLETADLLGLRVCALSANSSTQLLEEQVRRYNPAIAAVYDEAAARDFFTRVRDTGTRVVSGIGGLVEAAEADEANTVVSAVVGTVGLLPTLAAIKKGRRIALANKETLVCAGGLVMRRAQECGAEIIPVDSEHSAIFQCLQDSGREFLKRIILTASGGPFRGKRMAELTSVTPEMALRHPNWSMGRKITIDSATMMNKGLELIEAMHLFAAPPELIKIVVHPQSIVHSMVELNDNSVIAQLGAPDMRLPIQYALTYPARVPSLSPALDFAKIGTLTFEEPDFSAFPCLSLAMDTAKKGGTAGAVMNSANDAAVNLFLTGRAGFYDIYEFTRAALDNIEHVENPTIDDIVAADAAASVFVAERAK